MTVPWSGKPAAVEAVLPATKAITSTTFATPIVVTTTGAHGMTTGDYCAVYNATDPGAIGLWKVSVVSSTQVALLNHSTGANSVGTLAGGAAGVLAPAGFGATVPILSDSGDTNAASLWNVPYTALLDRVAWLLFSTCYALNIKAGGTLFLRALSTLQADDTSACTGVWDFASASLVKLRGRRALGTRQAITDGNVTIDVTQGARRTIVSSPGAARTITLDATTHVPVEGEVIEVTWVQSASPSTIVLTFKRDDGPATPIASITPSNVIADMMIHIRFEFSSGVWRLGPSSPLMFDGAANYGVTPLAGA